VRHPGGSHRQHPRHPRHRQDRPDLAALVAPLSRALVAAERPALDAHGLTMWAYIVLSRLEGTTVRTQLALAAAIGADKTRLIPTLDDLQRRGLIERTPDPEDRRRRLLSISPAGSELRARAQAAIRAHEERLLAQLPEAERDAFLRGLARLSALPPDELARSG
jgi:DNA-binding MarR family transcriptional regulator